MAEPPSSPPSEAAGTEHALSWYKSQYEQLESELAEFRDSSRELEQELEKDIERAEKQERLFQERAETLGFEVEEWKVSCPSFKIRVRGGERRTLTSSIEEIQGIKDRSWVCASWPREGDHNPAR